MTKSERLLNLLILLLVQRRYVAKEQIRRTMEAYTGLSDDAFERMFERDKDELRALGVPVETGALDAYFEDEVGYRVRPDEFALPGIDLTADEAAVVGLATRVWQHAGLAAHTSDALAKLRAAGVEVDRSRLDVPAPVVTVDDPAFEDFWQASLDRARVRFAYQRPGQEPTTRTLEPWGVVSWSARWYVVGRDVDRGEERLFRLSRVRGPVKRIGRGNAFTVPEGTDLRALTERLAPGPRTEVATLLVRPAAALGLRRRATLLAEGVEGPGGAWDRIELAHSSVAVLADEVLAHGAQVYVEEPVELREAVVERLSAAVGEHA